MRLGSSFRLIFKEFRQRQGLAVLVALAIRIHWLLALHAKKYSLTLRISLASDRAFALGEFAKLHSANSTIVDTFTCNSSQMRFKVLSVRFFSPRSMAE